MLWKTIVNINQKISMKSCLGNHLLQIPKYPPLRNYSALFRSNNLKSRSRNFLDVRFIQKPNLYSNKSYEDEEDVLPDDFVKGKNTKILSRNVPSLRLDSIARAGFNVSRNKIDGIFYQSKIRLNGEKVLKKSCEIDVGDVIDVIQGHAPDNDNFLIVNRVILLSAKDDGDNYKIQLVQDKSLLIENYDLEKC